MSGVAKYDSGLHETYKIISSETCYNKDTNSDKNKYLNECLKVNNILKDSTNVFNSETKTTNDSNTENRMTTACRKINFDGCEDDYEPAIDFGSIKMANETDKSDYETDKSDSEGLSTKKIAMEIEEGWSSEESYQSEEESENEEDGYLANENYEDKATELGISSPEKYYNFSKKRKRVTADLSPEAKKRQRLIYKIKNTETGKSYTGKTGQQFQKRVSGHLYGTNHPEKDLGKKQLYKELRAHPENFVIGIQATEEESGVALNELERICIAANRSFEDGYNMNLGGGGGEAKTTPSNYEIPELTEEQTRTPTKSYPITRNTRGNLNVQLSPNSRKTQNVVYGFKNTRTDEWLIGETAQKVGKRIGGYNFAMNHPEKDCGKLPLPAAVRVAPEDFQFYLLEKNQPNIKGYEVAWIAAKDSMNNGYNQNVGGGGSW